MDKIHIIGAGGLGKEIISYIIDEKPKRYDIAGVWSDEPFNNSRYQTFYRGSIMDAVQSIGDEPALLCLAMPKAKRTVYELVTAGGGLNWATYIHPSAIVSSFASIGRGVIVTPQCIVSSDAVLDDFVFMNTGSSIGHDSRLGKFTTLFPNSEVTGDCMLGEECILGIGAFTIPGVKLHNGTRVRAGSIVWKSPDQAGLLSGNPAILVQ